MRKMDRQQADRVVGRFGADVPGLQEEIEAALQPYVSEAGAVIDLETVEPMATPLRLPVGEESDEAEVVAERIIATTIGARPVARILDNKATTEFLGPSSPSWTTAITQAMEALNKVIPAVGRIELNNSDYPWAGTGWLVAPGILVTNRHVAELFARRDARASRFVFKPGLLSGSMSADIDFLEEENRLDSAEHPITSVLWIAPPDEADVAFLQVTAAAGGPPLPEPVALADTTASETVIAAIGYPARDPSIRDQQLVISIFGQDVYEKKRLAPGKVTAVKGNTLKHDCSTLGGNSGSLLVDLSTGLAVGLHRGGLLDDSANVAVIATHVRTLLDKAVARGAPSEETSKPAAGGPAQPTHAATVLGAPGEYRLTLQIPIEIIVRVGAPLASDVQGLAAQPTATLAAAVAAAQRTFGSNPDVLNVREGFRFKSGWITDEPVVVIEVREKLELGAVRRRGLTSFPREIMGIGVDVRTAALASQLEALGIDLLALERPGKPGGYSEPPGYDDPDSDVFLGRVKERMDARFHVSPDAGFSNLSAFIGRVKKSLTATMYEWDEDNHVSKAIAAAMAPAGNKLLMVTQKRGVGGGDATESAVAHMKGLLKGKFKHEWASVVGPRRLIPGFYHIKVASRDGEEFWLSSGNWKKSNQPPNPTLPAALETFNREWHAIVKNARLARLFQKYIAFDHAQARKFPLEEPEAPAFLDMELFVPLAPVRIAAEALPAPTYAAELEIEDEELDIQPLLTPDVDVQGRRMFMLAATEMMKRATCTLYIQNQAFNLTDDNNEEFDNFFRVVKQKQQSIKEVRIIMRDARDYPGDSAGDQRKLIERLQTFGLDTSPQALRLQSKCHTKGIIVDSREVLLGSQNLTNGGSLFNRDASLLVRTPKVAEFFAAIFSYDWDHLAHNEADEAVGAIRRAAPGEETPPGFRRVKLSELLAEDGPA